MPAPAHAFLPTMLDFSLFVEPFVHAFSCDQFVLPLPTGHRFPMQKYARLREAVRALPGIELTEPRPASRDELALVHDGAYIERVFLGTLSSGEAREIGFPWSEAMVERACRSVGATIAAARMAQKEGIAVNLAGGTHHALSERGSGFCVFNDVAVAIRVLQREALIGAALIVDLDVHQGNGSARIFSDDASVFTLSLHAEKNFPFRKEKSDLDIGLPDGAGDARYLDALDEALALLPPGFSPDMVFFLAGADPHENDRLGRLKLTAAGLKERDRKVFDFAHARGLPLVVTMAGGYGRDLDITVALHRQTVEAALAWQPHIAAAIAARRSQGNPAQAA